MSQVNVDGVGIEYQVTGRGRPVVLLHGWPDSGRLWRHQVPALADAGFQVIVPDLRGYGAPASPMPSRPTRCPCWPGTCWRSSPTREPAGRMWSAMTGAPPSAGCSPPSPRVRLRFVTGLGS